MANVTTMNVSSLETTGNLSITGNIIPVTQGNTYIQGNVVVAGNVYSALGELGVGGSLMFSLGSPYIPTSYTGSVPVAGTNTYAFRINALNQQGSSTFITASANGCFQFSQTGVYVLSGVFLTDFNNVLGWGIGSNVIDYGTRTDQEYLTSYVPFISQNPTEVLESQIYVSNTSLYYYIDLFTVDSPTLQATSNATWVSIAPLGGVSAASQSITLSTLGNIVTGQSGSYGAQVADYYVGMINGGTVTLPLGSSLSAGKTYVVKDESGPATTNRITVAATSPNLIDGSTSVTFNQNFMALTLLWTGTVWSII